MALASNAIPHFLGGEISTFAQGRFDKPDYRVSMRTCLNSFPVEIGSWVRRPGTQYGGHTRLGNKGRVIKFDFQASAPITSEFTDGFLRFRNGAALITTNDTQVVVAVSSANPAVVQTTSATNWVTGNTLIFPGASTPLLENRQFTATMIDTTHFSLSDALTGANIDGSTLGALVAVATVARVQELATSYIAGAWASIRPVQAETTDIMLVGNVAPQALTVTPASVANTNPVFAIGAAIFNDGPYLDPFTNGAIATPNQTTGVIQITVSFAAFVATTSYTTGNFVTSASVNYVSLIDQNVGNTPASSPSAWKATSASAAINNGAGFLGTDVGRLVRLFSEPLPWVAVTAYVIGNTVSYNPSGAAGASTYWQCIANSTGNVPGTDLTHWQLLQATAAQWTWGKIASLLNIIAGNVAGVAQIGTMTGNGGLVASFDGVVSKVGAASSHSSSATIPLNGANASGAFDAFVGQNYSGTGAGAFAVSSVTVIPSSDLGLANVTVTSIFFGPVVLVFGGTVFLYASNTAPSGPKNGTLLGTTGIPQITINGPSSGLNYGTGYAPITILSSDQVSTWKYVWVTVEPNCIQSASGHLNIVLNAYSAQVEVVAPATSAAASAGVNVELLGPPLLTTNPIRTWRMGAYSNTTGFPTSGIYNDGRLFLGGAIGNRFDACVSNGIQGSTINFAPTDQYGVVSAANAIAYTFNSKGVNQILWMKPDLQGVLMGTQVGEWLVQAPTAGSISPLNITARNVTTNGSANVDPIDTEHTQIFVKRYARKLLEFFPDVFSGKFSAPNLADKAQHLTRAGVAELAYTSAVTPIVWGRNTDGSWFGITYKRDSLASAQPPSYYGWHHHVLGSGRIVESIYDGPSTGGNLDALTMVTNDTTTNIRHVEVLTDTQDELTPLINSWFLDDAVNPTSTSTTNAPSGGVPYGGLTINGLWHLNGKTVQVFAGGLDCGDPGEGKPFSDFVVSNGSVTVPYGDSISAGPGRGLFTAVFAANLPLSQIVVGFTYNSDGQLVRPIAQPDSGARNGPAFGKLSRHHRYNFKVVNTAGLMVGATFSKLAPFNTKLNGNGAPLAPLNTFTGISADSLIDDPNYDNALCWRVSRPWPANVAAAGTNINTEDQ